MSVIKQIKLEDINGSLTELADIGAKAENVEFDNSDSGLEATNLQDAIVEITESGITGLKYTIDGDNDTYATIQNAVEDVRIGDRFYGYKNKATGILSHAEGSSTSATGDNSHTEGYNTLASGEASHAEGRNSIASNDYTHAEGNETTASGENSHAEGWETLSSGEESHSEGYQTIAGSYYSHAEGRRTFADHVSHAEGWETTASEESHAEGQTTSAIGISHAEGVSTTATDISHVEGRFSMAIGLASHAEGDATTASGQNGHTEGCETITNGDYSHAEGYRTTANVNMSHSEGGFTKADGVFSHTEGSSSISNGSASHAEGCETTADGDYSHAQNYYTNAGYHSQTVIGKYNDNKSATLFEVGNGEDADHRSNAFEVYSDGSLSTDNGTTKVKLEDVLTDDDVTVTQTLLSGTKIGSIDVNGISTDLFAPNSGSGSGDMLQSVYDPHGTVADAGGIVEYVGSMGGRIPWITPQDYGAVGDGVTDDTAAIQAAFNAAHTAGGGVVYFPKGVYLITPQIMIYSNTTVIGDKGESVVVVDQTYAQSKSMFQIGNSTTGAATVTNVHFRGMTFRGSETYGAPQGGLGIIGIWNVKHISFVDCLFQNNRYCAMKLIDASNIEIFNSRFEAVDCGVISQGNAPVNDVTIRGCHFTGLSSYSNFTNYYSESISAFCGQNTDPCERWRIEDCIFEHKLTVGVCFGATGVVEGSGHVANKNCIVRNCTFSGTNGTVVAQETEDLLIDGLYFDGSTKVMPYSVHTLLNFKSSKNIIVKNVVSKCTEVSFTIVNFSDLYNSNIMIDGLDAIVPYSSKSTPPNAILFKGDANSSLKNSNIIIKNAVLRANVNNTSPSVYIQYGNLEDSYIDVVPYENTLILSHYLPTTAIGKVVNNKIIVNTENINVRRSWGTAASISVADGNEWILVGDGTYDTSALPSSVNQQRMPKVYNITIQNKANYDASLAITDFYLMKEGYDFYIDFIASSYTAGKTFTFNKTGNIIPIDKPFTFSNDYKVVCHFVQKNAKWVEVERTLEYYAGANVDANDPSTDIDFATLLGGE